MSGQTRRGAFLLVAVSLGALAVAAGTLVPRQNEPSGPVAISPIRPMKRAPASSAEGRKSEVGRPGRTRVGRSAVGRWRTEARRQARRFLFSFLRYQGGVFDSRTRRTLAATATPSVSEYLRGAPPRPSATEGERPRVAALHLYGPAGGVIKASATLAYPGAGEPSLFELALRQVGGVWRVAQLYP